MINKTIVPLTKKKTIRKVMPETRYVIIKDS